MPELLSMALSYRLLQCSHSIEASLRDRHLHHASIDPTALSNDVAQTFQTIE
jgi:hypothetical protein